MAFKQLLTDYLHVGDVTVTHSYRLGRHQQSECTIKKRPLVVCFASNEERNKVLKLAKQLKAYKEATGQVVIVRPDLTLEQRNRQKAIYLQIQELKASKPSCRITVRNDRIYVDGREFMSDTAPCETRGASVSCKPPSRDGHNGFRPNEPEASNG